MLRRQRFFVALRLESLQAGEHLRLRGVDDRQWCACGAWTLASVRLRGVDARQWCACGAWTLASVRLRGTQGLW
jgi:hypothetical protein